MTDEVIDVRDVGLTEDGERAQISFQTDEGAGVLSFDEAGLNALFTVICGAMTELAVAHRGSKFFMALNPTKARITQMHNDRFGIVFLLGKTELTFALTRADLKSLLEGLRALEGQRTETTPDGTRH